MSGLLISGALNTLLNRLTAVRAGYLDLLDTLNSRLTATRAGYLDNLTRLDAVISTAPVGTRVRLFTASTTWISPATPVAVMVVAMGGGGGGAWSGAGTDGGASSFGALVTASGGSGGKTSSPGTTGYARGARSWMSAAEIDSVPGRGGVGFLGIGQGGPAQSRAAQFVGQSPTRGFAGNSGAVAIYTGTIAASTSITVTIGAGGAGSSESNGGRKGSSGAVLLFYW